jgi:hypothetical protein
VLRRSGVKTAAVAALVLALGLGLATAALAHNVRAAKAAVVVVKLKPLTVKVSGLKASEPIVLRLTGDSTGMVKGTASATGTVTLKLPKATLTACSSFTLRAVGTKGSVATLKKTAGAACKPTATVDFGSSVIVMGSRFKPGEHLSVTLIADGTRTKVGIASAKGLLNLSFGALPLSNCSAYTLKITGNKGSTFKKVQAALPC